MTAWDYRIVSLPPFEPATARPGASASVRILDEQGASGWEAVGMTVLADGSVAVLLKRPVDPDAQGST